MMLSNKERRSIESRILHRMERGSKVLYNTELEKVLYEYLVAVQAAKEELHTKLADINYITDKEKKENEKENTNNGNGNFGWRAMFPSC